MTERGRGGGGSDGGEEIDALKVVDEISVGGVFLSSFNFNGEAPAAASAALVDFAGDEPAPP